MPAPVLKIQAERFSATGGLAGEGVKKLLGAPTLTVIQTMIREAVQNSWDARLGDEGIEFHVRLRKLALAEKEAISAKVLVELPGSPASLTAIQQFLAQPEPVVLEISDWNTRGLGGPTRADAVPASGEESDFVNFIRNIGVPRDTDQGGGTYGYGKSALYSASSCSTILVDTMTRDISGSPIRRFIGCHVGTRFDDETLGRFTGRHWWGISEEEGEFVEPATGSAAAETARALGMADRAVGVTGTTVLILDPRLRRGDLRTTAAEILETFLWFFWPKMIPNDEGIAPIRFRLEVEGAELHIPPPEHFPPLDLFVEAYRMLKTGATGTRPIRCGKPVKLLGKCVIRQGFRGDRKLVAPPDVSVVPAACAHIAVMRPVELIVRYFPGAALPSGDHEWAGVFICDEDAEVEQAFADSEPPAHDDWVPDQLTDRRARTFVRVGRREIEKLAHSYAYPGMNAASAASDQPSLARVADTLGGCIPELDESSSGGRLGQGSRTGSGRRRTRVSEPTFVRLVEGLTGREGLFSVDVTNRGDERVELRALPVPILDGVLAAAWEDGDPAMPCLGWETADGARLSASDELELAPGFSGTVLCRVGLPDDAAVGVRISLGELMAA